MAVTIRDVAKQAGVSIRTVSRVMNNQGEISDQTRERVRLVIDELGYRPNSLARGLVSGKSLSVGLIITQITDPFFPEVVLGVESVARQHSYSVFLCNTNEDPQQEVNYVRALVDKQVDGIILCGTRLSREQVDEVASQYPISFLTSRRPNVASAVRLEAQVGITEITQHLLDLGHQKIGHLGWGLYGENERQSGYLSALQNNAITPQDHWIVRMPRASIETGREAAYQLMKQAPEITAITCYNDLTALGALQALSELGYHVPEDVSLVGFDDIQMSSLVQPALTTMRIPRFKVGQMVMNLLLQRIVGGREYKEEWTVQPELIVRSSTGQPEKVAPG